MPEINKNTIRIDSEGCLSFGRDQANLHYPVVFPTVTLTLEPTDALTRVVDEMRAKDGHLPMLWPDNWTEEMGEDDVDWTGWYTFQVSLNGFSDTRLDNSIEATVNSLEAADDGETYYISLTKSEQEEIYKIIDEQLKGHFNTSCAGLLDEALKRCF